MTPAITLLVKQKIKHRVHEYQHDPSADSFGLEAAEKLAVEPQRIFKTLVLELDSKNLVVGIVPVLHRLSPKLLAKQHAAKKAQMADKDRVATVTGYVLGGVSPLGQKKKLPTTIDQSAAEYDTIFVSGGRRGLDIELSPLDLAALCSAQFAHILQQ